MTFIWPPLLLLLALVPVGIWLYRERERRRAGRAATFGMVAAEPARPSPWRRRIPAVLTVLGVTILVLSLARPQSVIGVPRLEGTVLLAFDVSGSMAATDLDPTRMEAAKAAALALVERQPPSVRIGVVVFSDSGFSTQSPTYERSDIVTAIERLGPERGTSLGRGIEAALTVLAEADRDEPTDYYTNTSPDPGTPSRPAPTPVPAGQFEPAIIVLLTDGENTSEPDPLAAAQAARDRGIRIDTVGIGSAAGVTLDVEGFQVHTALDETMLRDISALTEGTYYPAEDQDQLARIYDDVGARLTVRTEPFELTPLFAGLGFLLLVSGGLVSLRWFGRLP